MSAPDEEDYLRGHPALITHVQKHVMTQASTNQALRECLQEGSAILSTYHAQLGVDRLRQLEELSSLQTELEELKKEEVHLEGRIDFLFHDCRRLEADNEVIMSGFVSKDASTDDVRRLLRLEGEKFEELSKKTSHVQDEVLTTSKQLVDLKGELRCSKRLRTDKRNASWDSLDDIGRIEETIAMAREEMEHLARRVEATRLAAQRKLAEQQEERRLQQQQRRTAGSTMLSTSFLAVDQHVGHASGSAGRTGLSRSGRTAISDGTQAARPIVSTGRTVLSQPPSSMGNGQSGKSRAAGALLCKRPDCIAVVMKLAELEDERR
jgi:predicted  nucleic acid-binding Zn-ribbon protein